MALGTPVYSTGGLDTNATLGPTTGIVAGTTPLNAVGAGQGDQLGITNNLINTMINVENNALQLDTYLQQFHFDIVPGATGVLVGPNIYPTMATSTIARAASTAGHQGQWVGTTTGAINLFCQVSNYPTTADIQTGFFGKMAFRAVILTGSTLPSGATGATTYGAYKIGLVDGLGIITGNVNEITWNFDPAVNAAWQLYLTKASTTTKTVSTITVATSTWYDLQIYVDSNGVQARAAVYSATALPTLLAGGPFTTNQPLTTTAMWWQILHRNGTAGTTSLVLNYDAVEFAGQSSSVGITSNYRGGNIVRSF